MGIKNQEIMAEAAPAAAPAAAAPTNEWKHGLFGCCDMGCMDFCKQIYCCGACNHGQAAKEAFDGNCIIHCLCSNCSHLCARMSVAEKYGINESAVMSFGMCVCCTICSIAQMIQEVADQKKMSPGCGGEWTAAADAPPGSQAQKPEASKDRSVPYLSSSIVVLVRICQEHLNILAASGTRL